MAIKLQSAREAASLHGVKMVVYGGAGTGKTTLCATLPGSPLIISAEAGLLSLRHTDLPVLQVQSMEDVYEAYSFVSGSKEGEAYDAVCIDSLTEIAEVVLASQLSKVSDPRQAYGELLKQLMDLARAFRDLPERHIYITAKMERVKDELSGAMLYAPMMPGTKLGGQIPYLFDLVMALRCEKNPDGKLERWLQTSPDIQYTAKDRSGVLDMYERPDLSSIISKITHPPTQDKEAA